MRKHCIHVESRAVSEQPPSEPEPVSQGGEGEEGEVQTGGEPEPESVQLEAAVDSGIEQVGVCTICAHLEYCGTLVQWSLC